MLLSFRLISASLKQISCDITSDIIMKQNISDVMQFLSNSEFQKIPLKKATAETSWKIIILISPIPLNSCFTLSLSLYIYILLLYIIIIYISTNATFQYVTKMYGQKHIIYSTEEIIIFFSEALSMSEGGKEQGRCISKHFLYKDISVEGSLS